MSRFPGRPVDTGNSAIRFGLLPVLLLSMAIAFFVLPGMLQAKEKGQYRISTFTCDATPPRDGHPLIWLIPVKTVETPLLAKGVIDFQFYAQKQRTNDFVAVAAYGDLGPGYICTKKSFSVGGYEPTASRAGSKSEPVMKKAIRELLGKE